MKYSSQKGCKRLTEYDTKEEVRSNNPRRSKRTDKEEDLSGVPEEEPPEL